MECAKTLKLKSSHSKPYLTDANKITRMKHALAFLQPSSNETIFDSMNSYVHVDEKWFYLTTVKKCFYAYDDEELPKRQLKSKRFITKVMFLAAVARPRYDPHKKGFFDGKIGIWPFVETVIAKRNSPNRPKGTPLIVQVTADVYRGMIIEKVIPAIKAKVPRQDQTKIIYLQQDNASPHNSVTTQMLLQAGVSGIEATNQPPNSPDFNVCIG
ncbi:hypothetical protein AaE_009173 [Aphanomyces astaci]|uniref:Tc1-like transposase DDE domain-containing protein n=1 Tax=Aphanomyces astaci TaxID=112090 RepID=A0A6A4ZT35_APHAT|nr:hypothetical protein AaE_009173 [Aphanomyces astaci]